MTDAVVLASALGLDPGTALALLTVAVAGLFVLGVPILLVFSTWALGFAVLFPAFGPQNMAVASYYQLWTFPLTAVPLFILVGALINQLRIARDIIDLSRSLAGWLPGSAANTALLTSGVFSAITGSNAATTASVGEAFTGELEEEGYDPVFSAATIAAGGTLGIVIPPSVLFILYGVTFNLPVSDLFIAGTLPGLLMLGGLIATATVISHRNGYGSDEYSFDVRAILRSVLRARNSLLAIVVLLGGIFTGVFTPSESASIAILFVVTAEFLSGNIRGTAFLTESVRLTVYLVGIIIPVLVTSILIQQSLSFLGLQDVVSAAILTLNSPVLIGITLIAVMLLSGSVLASIPNMILVAPLLAPAAFSLGISPLMWGVIFMISDAIGFITPPYGLNLYIISSITDIDYMRIAWAALPYLGVLTSILVLFFVFPELNVLAP
ncbi:TRAP transporter large permease [Halobellus rufus]|uniref:TRAP transporter large permease n=1 Tax=Halobellus rufus TaxID=1448860 RepID=UPI0006794637|nr:TRAP transporter large permease [Halobellus rufus]